MRKASEKILSLEETDAWIEKKRRRKLKIGFTCGAFDLLHAGHVQYLASAREACDQLIVAVNSDRSIQRYKDPLRPINAWGRRAIVVASLESVDCVVTLSEDRPQRLIERWRPDLYIKGGDYATRSLRSSELVTSYGGETVVIPVEYSTSTSRLVEYIKALERHSAPLPIDRVKGVGLVLLDRDGTLVQDAKFDPATIELKTGVAEGLNALQRSGFRLCIVTNQQGIGFGYFGYRDFVDGNRALMSRLGESGVLIDKIYFCPHSMADRCACRKPGTALIQQAIAEHDIEAKRVFFIGDSEDDMEAARRVGCNGLYVGEKQGLTFTDAVQVILGTISNPRQLEDSIPLIKNVETL
jgi:rfaE bifunctional protein nucleotidyltransferase chain/domain